MRGNGTALGYDVADPLQAAAESGAPAFVALFEDSQGGLCGTASLTNRALRLEGQSVRYGYLGDLRISPRMPAALRRTWRRFLGALIAEGPGIQGLGSPTFFLTAVLDGNERALKFLTKALKEVRYVPLQKYATRLAVASWPWARRGDARWAVRRANAGDVEAIKALLASGSPLGADADALEEHFATWKDFSVESFLVAEDAGGTAVGVVAPRFNPSRQLWVQAVPTGARWVLRAAQVFGMAELQVPGPLKILYLSHLGLSPSLSGEAKSGVLGALSHFAWREVARPAGAHAMATYEVPQFDFPAPRPSGFARMSVKGMLFEVHPAGGSPHGALETASKSGALPFDLSVS